MDKETYIYPWLKTKSSFSSLDWIFSDHHGEEINGHLATTRDVVFVLIYLSSLSHFCQDQYMLSSTFWNCSTSVKILCCSWQKGMSRRVVLDCIIWRESGAYVHIQLESNINSLHTFLPPKNNNVVNELTLWTPFNIVCASNKSLGTNIHWSSHSDTHIEIRSNSILGWIDWLIAKNLHNAGRMLYLYYILPTKNWRMLLEV